MLTVSILAESRLYTTSPPRIDPRDAPTSFYFSGHAHALAVRLQAGGSVDYLQGRRQAEADATAQGAAIQQAPNLPVRRPGLVVGGWVGRAVVARKGGGAELV